MIGWLVSRFGSFLLSLMRVSGCVIPGTVFVFHLRFVLFDAFFLFLFFSVALVFCWVVLFYSTRLFFFLFVCFHTRCHQQHVVEEEERGRRRANADERWALLEELAQLRAGE